jgi:hypothetical protein
MTTLKDTIRKIAEEIYTGPSSIVPEVESACLAAIRAFAEREPSEKMIRGGAAETATNPIDYDFVKVIHCYRAMMQQALKELESATPAPTSTAEPSQEDPVAQAAADPRIRIAPDDI